MEWKSILLWTIIIFVAIGSLVTVKTMMVQEPGVQVFASIDEIELGAIGYGNAIDQLSPWDSLRLWLSQARGGFTTIGGAVCSISPDKQGNKTFTQYTSFCLKNSAHVGIAFQVFDMTGGKWEYLGEKQILKDETKCFYVPAGTYYYTYYNCDSTAHRICIESDSGIDYDHFGMSTFTIDGQSTTIKDKCISANTLQEIYCDSDDSIQSKIYTCPYGCADGKCQAKPSTPSCNYKEDLVSSGNTVMKQITFQDCTKREIADSICDYECQNGACVDKPGCDYDYQLSCDGDNLMFSVTYSDCSTDSGVKTECTYGCEDNTCRISPEPEPGPEPEPWPEPEPATWYARLWDWIRRLFY